MSVMLFSVRPRSTRGHWFYARVTVLLNRVTLVRDTRYAARCVILEYVVNRAHHKMYSLWNVPYR